MNKINILLVTTIIVTLTGCLTDDTPKQEGVLSETQISAFLSGVKPPQLFDLQATRSANGVTYVGAGKLHPNHRARPLMIKDTIPAISVDGRTPHKKMTALLDTSSPHSWVEFSAAQLFPAKPLGVNDQVMPYFGGFNTGGVPAYASVITQLRIDDLFIEGIPIYVRMATGSLGPLARGVIEPQIDSVLGYDLLSQFEFVQFDFQSGHVWFSATTKYEPHEKCVLSRVNIVEEPGFGLAVEGAIFGKETPIILDVAGNYDFAHSEAVDGITKQVSLGNVVYRQVHTLPLPRNAPPRAGRQMLIPYLVTICPKEGIVYFERPYNHGTTPMSYDGETSSDEKVPNELFNF